MFGSEPDDDDEWAIASIEDDDVFEDDVVVADELENPADSEPQLHDGMPIAGYYRGEPIPDLNAIPQERWFEVMRPLSHWPLIHATATLRTQEQVMAAAQIKGQLWLDRPRELDERAPQMPGPALPVRGASRQINFRLGPEEHAKLAEAAKLFAMRPTALARALTMRGVNRALYEERRDR